MWEEEKQPPKDLDWNMSSQRGWFSCGNAPILLLTLRDSSWVSPHSVSALPHTTLPTGQAEYLSTKVVVNDTDSTGDFLEVKALKLCLYKIICPRSPHLAMQKIDHFFSTQHSAKPSSFQLPCSSLPLFLLSHQAWFPHSPSQRSVSTPWTLDPLNHKGFCNYKCPVYLKGIRGLWIQVLFSACILWSQKTEPGKETLNPFFIFH